MADGSIKILTDLSTEGFQKGVAKLGSIAKTGLSVVGSTITATGTALGALGGAAVKVGADFETSLAKASTLFGDVDVDTQKLKKNVLSLSNSTGLAADTIGNTLYDALSSGIPVSEDMGEAMDFMSKNANLARAGFTDINTAATATAKVLNAYKMDVSETDKVHKILMATQNKGITTVGELGAVLAQVTPTASAMNVSFEQLGAALATMTAQGTPTAQATTQLNSLFAELGKQGTVAQKSLAKATEGTKYAGKSFSDLMAQGVPLNEVLGLMGVKADMSDQSLIDMFGSIEAGKAALSMTGKNSEQFTTNLGEMSTSADLVGDAVEKMDDTLQVRFSKMAESAKNVGIVVYDSLQSPLKNAVDLGIGYIDELNNAFSTGFDSGVAAIGKVIADIAIKAAEATPKMLEAGVNAILAFCSGLEKNSSQIAKAAIQIGKALVSGFAKIVPQVGKVGLKIITEFSKQLFGSKIGSQVEKLGKTIESSFKKIGDSVSKGLSKIGPALEKVGSAAMTLTTGAISVLADGISFLAEHCDLLIPAIAGVGTALASMSIISSVTSSMSAASKAVEAFTVAATKSGVAAAASSTGITLSQIATGVLTGQVTLATAAQWAWNAALTAFGGPVGLIITAVAALGVGIAALCLTQEQEITAEEQLRQSQASLGDSYGGLFSKVGQFSESVQNASGSMDALTSTMGVTQAKQQELADQMNSVQSEITAIMKAASDERRGYTQSEIQTLQELFEQMREMSARELELQQSYQDAVIVQAQALLDTQGLTAEQYTQYAATIAAQAQQTRDSVLTSAQDKYTQAVAWADQEKQAILASEEGKSAEQRRIAEENYQAAVDQATADYQSSVDAANAKMTDTNAILAEGYAQRASDAQLWGETSQSIQTEELAQTQLYNDAKKELSAQNTASEQENLALRGYMARDFNSSMEELDTMHTDTMGQLQAQRQQSLSDTAAEQLATLTGMVTDTGLSYDQMQGDTKTLVDQMLATFSSLSDESKSSMNETLKGMEMEIDSGGNLVYTAADKAGKKVISGWSKNQSPSIAAAKNTARGMSTEVNALEALTGNAGGKAGQNLGKNWSQNDPKNEQLAKTTVGKMNLGAQSKEGEISKTGGKMSDAFGGSWSKGDIKRIAEAKTTVNKISNTTGSSKVNAPKLKEISNASSVGRQARSDIQNQLTPVYQKVYVRTVKENARGGYYAKGGVTRYARGGVSPEIHKHAAGVFTKRTRLWDPVTGINEYGEAGHEALLPLKTSVYNEIAKGIVRQLSPAKLSGIVDTLRAAVQNRRESITIQIQQAQQLDTAVKTISPDNTEMKSEMSLLRNDLAELKTAVLGNRPDNKGLIEGFTMALRMLKIQMDGQQVGTVVNERLGNILNLEERGRF